MSEGSETLECPRCGYDTIVFDTDGHAEVCPDCGQDGLFEPEVATEIKVNRMQAFRERDGDDPVDLLLGEDTAAGGTVDVMDLYPEVESRAFGDYYGETPVRLPTGESSVSIELDTDLEVFSEKVDESRHEALEDLRDRLRRRRPSDSETGP